MAFHWTGIRYQLSQIDVALFPTSIPDNVWRLRHTESGVPTVCKHIKGVFDILNKNSSQILKAIKIKYSNPQRVARIKKLKNTNQNGA